MVVINKEVLTSALGVMKIIMGVFGLLIAGSSGPLAKEGDRFNFNIAFGLMVMIWCFVSFLLYLCDCVTKCKPETMRIIEMAVAIFLVILGVQAFVYATESAVKFSDLHGQLIKVDKAKGTDLVFVHGCPKPNADSGLWNSPWVINHLNGLINDLPERFRLCATTSFFCIATVILFAVTIFIAYKRGVPGTPHVEPAHVAN